ncbi:MAG: TonB-dependent receptor, partial [Alphaproteobacteria bacterium]|nr:TonB-dependent receptor [Alphaproteobacteria bacterium]
MKRLAATCLFLSINAQAAQAVAPVPEQPIIVTAPGGAADKDDAVELDAAKLALASGPDVLRAVSTQVAGMSLSDAQGNRHQPSLMYRGYSASA